MPTVRLPNGRPFNSLQEAQSYLVQNPNSTAQQMSRGAPVFNGGTNNARSGPLGTPEFRANSVTDASRRTGSQQQVTLPGLNFDPQYAELIRQIQTNIQQTMATRDRDLARNQQDIALAQEDITRARGRAGRAQRANLASRGTFDSTAGRRSENELAGDFDRIFRDVGIGATRQRENILSGAQMDIGQLLGQQNQARLGQARDSALARLEQARREESARANQEFTNRLNALIQGRTL